MRLLNDFFVFYVIYNYFFIYTKIAEGISKDIVVGEESTKINEDDIGNEQITSCLTLQPLPPPFPPELRVLTVAKGKEKYTGRNFNGEKLAVGNTSSNEKGTNKYFKNFNFPFLLSIYKMLFVNILLQKIV